jgi:3-hydroxyisobutyrate dehydrogenase-like beta-hydroxyacid dehydrogenase
MQEVTVIGLGSMGATLARLFLERGRKVTVWNRSPGKADALLRQGARLADSPAAAIAASPVSVMCVYDYRAVDAILQTPAASQAGRGRVLVQLTTGSPQEAIAAAQWAARHGLRYVEGAIQAAPSQMGKPDTPVLVSGNESTYREVQPLLDELAGNIIYLGEQIDAASTMDMATLSYVYGAFAGFVHGARLAESRGLDVGRYGRIVSDISPSFGAFFAHEGGVIQSGDFRITESPLRISVEATARILQASRDAGLDTEIPALPASLLARAQQAGYGDEEIAAVVKVLRQRPH